MKKFLNISKILLVSICALILFSCEKEKEAPYLTPSTTEFNIEKEGKVASLAIESNSKWIISSNQDWATLSTLEGMGNGVVAITVAESKEFKERYAEVKIIVEGLPNTIIKITQLGDTPIVTVSPSNFEFPAEGGNLTLDVTANCPWSLTCDSEAFTIEPKSGEGSGKVTVTAPINTTGSPISSKIIFTEEVNKTTKEVEISQKKLDYKIDIAASSAEVSYDGGIATISLESNTAWVAKSNSDWAVVNPASGEAGSATITITATPNTGEEREAIITISDAKTSTVSVPFTIKQSKLLNRTTDSLALVALYNATDGANWQKDNWDLSSPIDTWKGIRVRNNRVDSLHIATKVISKGTLPAELGDLDKLRRLTITSSNLSGAIPAEIYKLSNLVYFEVNNNSALEGNIADIVKAFPKLEYLNVLSCSKITGVVPAEIGKMKNLFRLYLSGTGISGDIPAELGECTALAQFGVFNTKITSLPDIFDKLPHINIILAQQCTEITHGLPKSLAKIDTDAATISVQLHSCNFTGGIPQEWENLPAKLGQLQIHTNQLKGVVPAKMQEHPQWTKWNAAKNILPQREGFGLTLE